MRVHSIDEFIGRVPGQAARAAGLGPVDLARAGSGHDRQRRAGDRERRRVEPRRPVAVILGDDMPADPGTTLAAIVAALSLGTPVEAQASCHHVAAAYSDED